MSQLEAEDDILSGLNPQQREAASHGEGPLLIVAGAGTGKTATLVHRVAWLIGQGIDPRRILLLTFTRRAAGEMLRRVDRILARQAGGGSLVRDARVWGGTFHAIATRLLRLYGKSIGLAAGFTIHDRSDSEDLLNVVRTELGLAKTDKRFPKKGTCMSIYSRCVNARQRLAPVLKRHFPWCEDWEDELKRLFDAYLDRKEAAAVLDYDDLLLYWDALLADEEAGERVRARFDCVLVDEYQDTNSLQASILARLCPTGRGLTVVGDDAQSIYGFRAATVRNILDFPKQYPAATIVHLEQNYRSTQPILAAANAVIGQARERYQKQLWSDRSGGDKPLLVTCENEQDQTESVIRRILQRREEGIDLRRQAVLFRASHHSIMLEAELTGRNIPFHKYGGLKFVETAHVKDLMAFLRLAENPRDLVAGSRVLVLLPGIGPKRSRALMQLLVESGGSLEPWRSWTPPLAAASEWPRLVELLEELRGGEQGLPAQIHAVRAFYEPILLEKYDNPAPRSRDLEQVEQLSSRYADRQAMLVELTLDPPSSTQDLAGPPQLDEDYLVLSTIHSAKGLEWDSVFVIHAVDGNIPSDMATGSPEEIEEELRLLYVALSRAENFLCVTCPLSYYYSPGRWSDAHGFAQMTRFLPPHVRKLFRECVSWIGGDGAGEEAEIVTGLSSEAIRRQTKDLWS
ncbi:MAG: ATP-dependent helicase [Pirellulales bacterium]|jgi:DNA helicase-2/ATP-dependent DNA helicase PcrA|nr:ATP-dependent helicase [Thermoguttaceae bacterium]MDD4787406.1 ATP-dependent helicase [Pirellulales bacterium]NLZ02492.1 ATP-dependent helicase [Pirellulaceae bacterium]